MGAERFFDDLARKLAEPMPRRRAVRVIGASLAALAVPGVSPRSALAGTARGSGSAIVCAGAQVCKRSDWKTGTFEEKCCPFPMQQWKCGGADGYVCIDTCAETAKLFGKKTKATLSTERMAGTDPDGRDRPKRYDCCFVGEHRAVDGECLPNCPYQHRFGGAAGPVNCGKTCCATHQPCVNGRCRQCEDLGGHSCQPAKKGKTICCKKGTNCCFNDTTTACCGPKQTCHASETDRKGKPKPARCSCDSGKKCGSDCCEKGETCTSQGCCPSNRVCPGETKARNTCCDGADEYCFFKNEDPDVVVLAGQRTPGTCKQGCAPGNRAETQCCGTGFKANRARTACVPE